MKIRTLQATDAQSYQDIRLEGLRESPEAFGSTYEREVEFPLELVIERLKPGPSKFVLGAFNDEERLVGVLTFVREDGVKTKHKGNVYGMYVSAEARGMNIGRNLLLALIEKAKQLEGLEQINLTVVSHNEPAKSLYSALGFQVYGTERNALKYGGKYFDEDLMVLPINL